MEGTNGKQKIEDVIRVLEEEITSLRGQRANISTRIASMRQIVLRLKHLSGTGTDRHPGNERRRGFTRACRLVLMESLERPLTIREVFRAIQTRLAPEMLTHKDPRASVATILGRLVEYGEVEMTTDGSGKRAYRWIDQGCVTRESYELVVPGCSPINPISDPAERRTLHIDEKL